MVWTLEWVYPSDNDSAVTIFDSEMAARKQACIFILNRIRSEWDLSDSEYSKDAILIAGFISSGTLDSYVDAMKYWNYHSKNTNSSNSQYWYVQEHIIFDIKSVVEPDFSFLNIGNSVAVNDVKEEVEKRVVIKEGSGAICRKCNVKNEYATADNMNGTYICRSCSIFGSMFG